MTNILSDLRRLTEAVHAAGADIAPTYREYVQLAFAIATDCGEAGRSDFLMLCSLSAKYDVHAANKLFSNALKTNNNSVHIGTAFHLAELCNVRPRPAEKPRQDAPAGTLGTPGAPYPTASHTHAHGYYNKAEMPAEEFPEAPAASLPAEAADAGTANSGTACSGTACSGTTYPGTTYPEAPDPEAADAGTANSGTACSGTACSGTTYPGTTYPEAPDPEAADEETCRGSEPLTPLPCFDNRTLWPAPLNEITAHGTTRAQQDIMLLGAVTVLGASMNSHVRCAYGGKMISPSLQTFIVALPASGKGVLSLVRLLVEPIHDEIRLHTAEAMKQYRKEKGAYDSLGKERSQATPPALPPDRMFLISGNNTGTGILQNIMDSEGIGLICESEADTISTAIGSEHGHWSDTMRKAFDHDRLSYNRRTDREYREVKRSYLSVLLSGTPAQVKPLIPTAENGLFSRQLFYYMPAIHKWQNQFDRQDTDLETVFTGLGMQWREQLKRITAGGLFTLRLTPEQKELFNNLFANLFIRSHLANGSEMASSVARLAINICRIMQVVAMLRVLESDDIARSPHLTPDKDISGDNLKDGIITRWDMTILPADFNSVLELTESLYRHATHILSFLPGTEISRRSNADRDALLQSMEREFTRSAFLMQAEATGIKPGTASTWLKRLVKHGMIESVDGKGTYRKPLPNGM